MEMMSKVEILIKISMTYVQVLLYFVTLWDDESMLRKKAKSLDED